MKSLEYYKNLEYRIIIEKQSFENETFYICYSDELGKYSCYGQGENIQEATNNYFIEKDLFIESLLSNNLSIPEPDGSSENLLSGVFNLRTDPVTHTNLAKQAKKNKLSLNQYVNKLIDRNLTEEIIIEKLLPKFDEMKELIVLHDCNVKQQFRNFWLNTGMKSLASRVNDDWAEVLNEPFEYGDLAA